MSSYIIDRDPSKYGGQQQGYIEHMNAVVTETTNKFHEAVSLQKDLTALFHETLDGQLGSLDFFPQRIY